MQRTTKTTPLQNYPALCAPYYCTPSLRPPDGLGKGKSRVQDEFGFSPPIVAEFKKRTGVDITRQPFSRTASRYDWYALRGEYVTAYFRELKAALGGKPLGLFINPQQPHFPQPWNVPELVLTFGHIYFDLETWARDELVQYFLVYGYCHPAAQQRAIERCEWLVRGTPSRVGALTSSPFGDAWKPARARGIDVAIAVHDEAAYLERSGLPAAGLAGLASGELLVRMKALEEAIHGKIKPAVAALATLLQDGNLLVRRMACLALGKTKDPAAVPLLEATLADREPAVQSMAALALRDVNGPESTAALLAAVEREQNHPLVEIVVSALPRITPAPRKELAAALKSPSAVVRWTVARALVALTSADVVPDLAAAMAAPDRPTRFAATMALGNVLRSPAAVEALLEATRHDDPVVSDRAATSLALIAARAEKETESLRPRILKALDDLYGLLGDDCRRADREWGYRPVGNALLKLGPEGEAVLTRYMNQSSDRRLAEQAWRSLYIRQDNGTFSEVTEKENDEAFRRRPKWLDR